MIATGLSMRILFRLLLSASLILLAATSFMSIRSYFRGDYWGTSSHGRCNSISSAKGSIVFDASEMDPIFRPDSTEFGTAKKVYYSTYSPPRTWQQRLGFWSMDMRTSSGPFFRTIIPYWPLILIFAVIPLDALIQLVRAWLFHRCHRIGICGKCGYDLRESKDRCPECGNAIPITNLPPAQSLPPTAAL